MTPSELTALIDSVLDGACSEADFLRLEAELHVDARARQLYYERLQLHEALTQQAGHEESRPATDKVVALPSRANPRRWLWGGVGAAAAASLALLLLPLGEPPADPGLARAHDEAVASGFGVLAESSDAVWASRVLARGELLPTGPLQLTSGLAKLELFSGVQVILEGEAEFEIHSAMEMTVHRGRLQAHVPEPAQGFRVRTASGEVVDLGTRFAMNITPEHHDLQVLEGEVEWHPHAAPMENLLDGEALRWTGGQRGELPRTVDLFAKIVDFEQGSERRRQAWEEHSDGLRNDPRLLAYFTRPGSERGNRQLPDQSPHGRHGTIVRASRVPNRWGESDRALDFGPTGSRVRLQVPGQHEALTLFCWLRIDSLDRHYNSLFLTDGHELHEPHWQILADGRLFFSVKAYDPPAKAHKHIAHSPPIWTPAQSGQWMQIATVYDSHRQTTTHYLNGQAISEDHLPEEMVVKAVKIGAASIGNWSEPYSQDPDFAVRNLNGAIDEFALFATALSAEEIKNLYEIGKP
ncbi:LamG-like jellyroll fold domain-containing protein [Roseibacillus ishigakijimensis]|uniref:FecR domain-containing protein n=1 Tax=Roseibacillus ishigakijimensis TaxID=454146 RepID=A0A934RSX6_9BACT|nr:LamG-like jellyroll fold domain-containing protein [Roseibacillus ishigakijimensis]MBK1833625.1 FecR domain-containing protein [Roseibacillus ishigakijimensis]